MELLKKQRKVLRVAFTKSANQLDACLKAQVKDPQVIDAAWELLEQRQDALKKIDADIFTMLLQEDASEEVLSSEITTVDEYTMSFLKLKAAYHHSLPSVGNSPTVAVNVTNTDSQENVCKYKLPLIEFKKFDGSICDWLSFWSQFKKINGDTSLAPEDKFQYLIQATTPGSRARDLVASYPPTAENYRKVIESITARFGRHDLLVEFYVRELLKLVLHNASNSSSKAGISFLYDKIETHLRSLETLGIMKETYSAMLYPLIESCLPEELLRAWQRYMNLNNEHDAALEDRLTSLMKFLRSEVESEERISLAIERFNINPIENRATQNKFYSKPSKPNVPSSSALLSQIINTCVFCNGNHDSGRCFKLKNMTFEEKREKIITKRACSRCAKIGHSSRKCRYNLQCIVCGKLHVVYLCPEISFKDNNAKVETVEQSSLGNYTDTRVFMQTIRVKITNNNSIREVRAVLDTGSQRSYVLKTTVEAMKYTPKRMEKIKHVLFGGTKTCDQNHYLYDVNLTSLNDDYNCKFEVLDQTMICHDIVPVFKGKWTKELCERGIKITDDSKMDPIELLIGADVIGKLLTGKRRILRCGLVAVETLLGWTLMGKIPSTRITENTTMPIVKEIRNQTNRENRRFVSGDLNSRRCSPGQIVNSKWWERSNWIHNHPEVWPNKENPIIFKNVFSRSLRAGGSTRM